MPRYTHIEDLALETNCKLRIPTIDTVNGFIKHPTVWDGFRNWLGITGFIYIGDDLYNFLVELEHARIQRIGTYGAKRKALSGASFLNNYYKGSKITGWGVVVL